MTLICAEAEKPYCWSHGLHRSALKLKTLLLIKLMTLIFMDLKRERKI